jgi:hypothetical protein
MILHLTLLGPVLVLYIQSKSTMVDIVSSLATESDRLPQQRPRAFFADLLNTYHRAADLIVSAYTCQTTSSDPNRLGQSAKNFLSIVVDLRPEAISHWPTFLLRAALASAIAVPAEGESEHTVYRKAERACSASDLLAERACNLLSSISDRLDMTSTKLFQRLDQRLQQSRSRTTLSAPIDSACQDFTLVPDSSAMTAATTATGTGTETVGYTMGTDFDLSVYTGSDSFWDNLDGIFALIPPNPGT